MRKILAPTDFSKQGNAAASRGAAIACEFGADLALFHVMNLGSIKNLRLLFRKSGEKVAEKLRDEAAHELHALAKLLSKRYGVRVSTGVVQGNTVEEINKRSVKLGFDLIVVGAHGAGMLRGVFLGSTSDRLVRKTSRPVLVVRRSKRGAYSRVLVPVDFSSRSLSAARFAQLIAPKAEIVLLHAFELPFEGQLRYAGVEMRKIIEYRLHAKRAARQELENLARAAGLNKAHTRFVVLHGAPSLRIVEEQMRRDSELVVIGKHGRNVVEKFLLGSVTQHVLSYATADVLVVD